MNSLIKFLTFHSCMILLLQQEPCMHSSFKFYYNGEIVTQDDICNKNLFINLSILDTSNVYIKPYTINSKSLFKNNYLKLNHSDGSNILIQIGNSTDTMSLYFVNALCFVTYCFDSIPYSKGNYIIDGNMIFSDTNLYIYPNDEIEKWLLIKK